MLLAGLKPVLVTYKERDRVSGQGWKRRIIEARVEGLSERQNKVTLDVPAMGLSRVLLLSPSPMGSPFLVAWDGDKEAPSLTFNGAPSEATVLLDVWGF